MNYLEKLQQIKNKYGDPFIQTNFPKPLFINQIIADFSEGKEVSLAGRLILKREHGKSGFAHISDQTGKMQIFCQLNTLADQYRLYKDLDIGDIVGVKGELFKTRTGENTILVKELILLAKTLRGLPEKWHGLTDVETRYRRRYVDLIVNSDVRQVFVKRAEIIAFIRQFFIDKNYTEVETPMLHQIAGGAAGRPFITHHNVTDQDVYLRIAPELYLKRLLVGGMERVFEINRSFRNEGVSTRHNPEFTMLEAYCAWNDYAYMMDLCEQLFFQLAMKLYGTCIIEYQGKKIDFTPPWQKISFAGLFNKEFGVEISDTQDQVVAKVSAKLHLKQGLTRSQVMNITEELIEKNFPADKPAFIIEYFTWSSPLAKKNKQNPNLVDRFELFIAGLEVANAYSELNDPVDQLERFRKQLETEEELPKKIDIDFITSLEYGMPCASGLGIGIDRLIMIMLNQPSIRDVILFPLMRLLEKENED